MSWRDLLTIRQQLRRPTLTFYVDKKRYKARMLELGIAIPDIYYVQNAGPDADVEGLRQHLENVLAAHSDYVAKPTHLSCSDHVYVVKAGRNIYLNPPDVVESRHVAATLVTALRTQSSLRGESWALHHVVPGVIVEERISAVFLWLSVLSISHLFSVLQTLSFVLNIVVHILYVFCFPIPTTMKGEDDSTAALEFKTIVIWGRVWVSEVKRGTDTIQTLGADGRGHNPLPPPSPSAEPYPGPSPAP
jgi:hypothetical protein